MDTTLHKPGLAHKPGSDRLSALLIPALEALEAEWRSSVHPSRRPYLKLAHEGLGRLLELELEAGVR